MRRELLASGLHGIKHSENKLLYVLRVLIVGLPCPVLVEQTVSDVVENVKFVNHLLTN